MKKYLLAIALVAIFILPIFLVRTSEAVTLDELQIALTKLEKRVSLLEGFAWQRWDPRISTTTSIINPKDQNTIGDFFSGSWVRVKGARLTSEIRIVPYPTSPQSIPYSLKGLVSSDGTVLDFKLPDYPAGIYNFYLVDPSDTSRTSQMVSLRVKNRPSATPDPAPTPTPDPTPIATEISPRISTTTYAGPLIASPGENVIIRGARLTTDVKITKAGDASSSFIPLNISNYKGEGLRIDFKVDPTMPVGNYNLNVYSASGVKSNTLPFKVVIKTSSTDSLSQMANILDAMSLLLSKIKS